MTTLTSFSSLEISELEVKGLILSLFQVILVADGSNYLSHFFGTISHGNLKEITSTSFHQSLIQSSSYSFSRARQGKKGQSLTAYFLGIFSPLQRFFARAKKKRSREGKGSNPRPWKRRQVPKFLTTGLGFGNLSTALGYNLGRSSSCQCLFSFSFEDDLITKIGRLLTAPEFCFSFLSFSWEPSQSSPTVALSFSTFLLYRAREMGEKKRSVEEIKRRMDSRSVSFFFHFHI